MAAKPNGGPPAAAPQQALRLSELIGALSREFASAAASHHATLGHWKKLYEDNPVLADYSPRGMQIVSAQVSLPVAVSEVAARPPRVGKLTRAMIAEALSPQLPKGRRQELAKALHAELARRDALSLANQRLPQDLRELARKAAPELAEPVDTQALADLQREFAAQPDRDSELSVLYRTRDLQQVRPELMFRVNLELRLD